MKNLRFNYLDAADAGDVRHAKLAMREIGITYKLAVPQTMGDQWWFFGCQNVPDVLPKYITEITVDPMELVGHGLTLEEATEFSGYNHGL